jgi:hypothetical protein
MVPFTSRIVRTIEFFRSAGKVHKKSGVVEFMRSGDFPEIRALSMFMAV